MAVRSRVVVITVPLTGADFSGLSAQGFAPLRLRPEFEFAPEFEFEAAFVLLHGTAPSARLRNLVDFPRALSNYLSPLEEKGCEVC